MQIHSEYRRGVCSLQQLVAELERQRASKIDFVVDSRDLMVLQGFDMIPHDRQADVGNWGYVTNDVDDSFYLVGKSLQSREWLHQPTTILDQAQQQIGDKCDPNVPWSFYQRLRDERPERFKSLINGLLEDTAKRRFVRILDGNVRGFLSANYRVLDHHDIAFTSLDSARAHGGEVIECSLSDKHMRIKFTARDVWDKIDQVQRTPEGGWYAGGLGNAGHLRRVAAKSWGDLPGGPGTVYPIVTISNSETGHGGFNVRIGILLGICFNIATVEQVAAKVHLGGTMEAGIFTEEAVAADSKAIMLKARDAVSAAFKQDQWSKIVARAQNAQRTEVQAPGAAVDNVIKQLKINESSRDELLQYFLGDYDKTAWGMAQAVSRLAQDTDDADAADDLEVAAGAIIKNPKLVAVTS